MSAAKRKRPLTRYGYCRMRKILLAMVTATLLPFDAVWASDDQPFALLSVPSAGRTAAAELVDLDGDGRTDLVAAVFDGIPPKDSRELRAWFQRDDGSLPDTPDLSLPLPEGAAAYDLVDLDGVPGMEIALLRRDRLSLVAFTGRKPQLRELPLPGPTIAAARDERGLDRLLMLRDALPGRLLVPGLGELFVADPTGEGAARLDVGSRSNYFLPPRPGPGIGENEVETFYDFPRIDVGDVDGDGRPDLIASNRFEIRVFLQRPDGAFPARADRALAVGRVTEQDLIRGSGLVRLRVEDFDGDGRADVVLTYTAGGLLEARSRTTLHRNREGTWNLESADQEFQCDGCFVSYDLQDIQGDGSLELLEARVPLGILQLVETLLTRSADIEVRIYERDGTLPFSTEPWVSVGLDLGFRFETYEPRGFFPTLRADWNGDGSFDRLASGNGEALEIYLGGSPGALRRRAARQSFDTNGALRIGDLDGDELPDLLVFDRTRPDSPIRIGVNRGTLPGTPQQPRLTAP
jgi:hypothetical protein